MRVALVSTYGPPHPGGIEYVAANTFEGYRRRGVEVRWVTSRIPSTLPGVEGSVTRVACVNRVEDRLGVPVPLWGTAAWRALREACAWADVVHVIEALYVPSAMAVAAARRAGKPVIVSQNVGAIPYDSVVLRAVQRLAWATLGRSVLRRASVVILSTPPAESFVRRLMGDRLPPSAAFPVGVDTVRFRPPVGGARSAARHALALDEGRPVALFAGRLVEKKGLPLVLEAAALAPAVRFLVAGDGPLRTMLEHAPTNVAWLGHVSGDRMTELYWAADAAVLPSKGEGLPLFVQEAMASGLPVVVSGDEEYARSLIEAGVCRGVERNGPAVAEAVTAALSIPAHRRLQTRAWAETHWNLDRMAERYLALIATLPRA
jgi:glycosyltransferase involved in cell wall biosynthesis